MQISVDTKHDSHEDIRKVIAMLKHIIGEQDVLTNEPSMPQSIEQVSSPEQAIGQIPLEQAANTESFADLFEAPEAQAAPEPLQAPEIVQPAEKKMDDLFSDLLSEEDLPEAKQQPEEEEEDETPVQKPKIEFY